MSESEPEKSRSLSHRIAEKLEARPWRWIPDFVTVGCLPVVGCVLFLFITLLR